MQKIWRCWVLRICFILSIFNACGFFFSKPLWFSLLFKSEKNRWSLTKWNTLILSDKPCLIAMSNISIECRVMWSFEFDACFYHRQNINRIYYTFMTTNSDFFTIHIDTQKAYIVNKKSFNILQKLRLRVFWKRCMKWN